MSANLNLTHVLSKFDAPLAPRLPDSVTNPAKWTHERIVRSIVQFENRLGDSEEIGLRLVNFTGKEVIHVDDVGYWGPDLVIFHGRNADGYPVELIQHVTQVSVLLVSVPKETEKPRRIGFDLEKRLDQPSTDGA